VTLVIVMFFTLLTMSFSMAYGGGSGGFFGASTSTSDNVWRVALLLVTFAYLGHQSLSMGASLIASSAENHALSRRFVTLAAMVAIGVAAMFYDSYSGSEVIWLAFFPLVAVPALAIALTESSHVAPGLIQKFRKRGPLGLIFAAFFIPGRASGYFFTLLLMASALAIFVLLGFTGKGVDWNEETVIRILGIWGTMLFPAVVLRFIHRGDGQRIGPYLLILLSTMAFWTILQTFSQATGQKSMLLFVWCPIVFTLGDVDAFESTSGGLLILAVLFLMNAILAIGAIRELMQLFKSEAPSPAQPS